MIIILLLFVFLVPTIHGMNSNQDVDKSCLLARLPNDIKRLIAELLPFRDRETEQEFIERTQQQGKVPDELFKKFLKYPQYTNLVQFCPNRNKIVLIEYSDWDEKVERLAIINPFGEEIIFDQAKKNDSFYIKDYAEKVSKGLIKRKKIALSADGFSIAGMVTKKKPLPDDGTERIGFVMSNFLMIYNTATQKQRKITLNDSSESIDFNKQGTHIIVHGEKRWSEFNAAECSATCHRKKIYTMYPIDENKPQFVCEKNLEDYLSQYGICKDINSSRNLKRSNAI